jgi:penicillin-binding protein 1C
VQFEASTAPDALAWRLDGAALPAGAQSLWKPTPGRHQLVLVDRDGNELDRVWFEVRGREPPAPP